MSYFFGIELLLLSTLLVAKLVAFPRLSESGKMALVERWSINFSYEIINRILAITVSLLVIQNIKFAENLSQTWFHFLFYVLLLDFIFYWRHRLYHRWLWAIHRTHHSDQGYDFSLSLRIHPVETLIQILIFVTVSIALTINQWHIFLAAHLFSVQALLSHLDYPVPNNRLTRFLRNVFVYPDSHRYHHEDKNPDTNFGFLFSIWDTIFKTKTNKN